VTLLQATKTDLPTGGLADGGALYEYLAGRLPDFDRRSVITKFEGGQSNPTYLLTGRDTRYVLRKKPPGVLLPSAHAIEREFRVLRALQGNGVPVPRVHLLCIDEQVIGQSFYVMEYVEGRVVQDSRLPGMDADERRATYSDMNRVMAALHSVDYRAIGLEDFGRPEGYVGRQVKLWTRQYRAAGVGEGDLMDRLAAWLEQNCPPDDETALVHGDFRLGNLILHPTEPRVLAVLDWELATLGHPLCDVGYNCLPWHQDAASGGLRGMDVKGVPSERNYLASYAERVGRPFPDDMKYFVVFSLFRTASILAGVYRRAQDGHGASNNAIEIGARFRTRAAQAWEIATAA
jgi:aminoglycoside phosphotransferase (APT) family kinase protein